MKKGHSSDVTSVFPGALKLTVLAITAVTMSGCLGSGGGSNSNVKRSTATPVPATLSAGGNIVIKTTPVVTPPTVASAATGIAPTGDAVIGTAPTPSAVIAAAGTEPSVAAGTAAPITPEQVVAGGTAGTQGIAGLSVSMPTPYNFETKRYSFGAVTIDPTFSLAVTGSIVDGTVTSLAINSANATTTGSSLTIAQDAEHTVTSSAGWAHALNNSPTVNDDLSIYAAQEIGYSYTQYGDWYQCSANCVYTTTGSSNEVNGIFVRGEATAPANIPTTGTATYIGDAYGVGIDATGNVSNVYANNMTANANFATRTLAFSTSNTEVELMDGGMGYVANSDLNMVGTLTYAAGQNLFTGTVTTVGTGVNAMTGTATGRFNGPAAQEIGGVFAIKGTGGGIFGGFAGRQKLP